VLEVMELRPAAERANRRQVAAIRTAWRAIAETTGNRHFPRFLAFLGSHVIPRQIVRLSIDTPAERRAYLERIQLEHARIVSGISDRNPAEARRAMREHLMRSLERCRRLAQGEKNGRR
jgi:DNA-binding FadR family transcriptional regulator